MASNRNAKTVRFDNKNTVAIMNMLVTSYGSVYVDNILLDHMVEHLMMLMLFKYYMFN